MARYLFGGGLSDYVVATNYPTSDATVRVNPGASLTAWSASTGGSKYTSLQLEYGGEAVDTLTADPEGRVPRFYGPDGVTQVWIDAGEADRYVLVSTDLGAIVDTKLDKDATPAPHTHAGADVPTIQRALDSSPRWIMFDPATNLWPYQPDVTATYPPVPIFWRGNAAIPVQLRRGMDYIDQLEGTYHGGSTNIPDTTPEPDEDPIEDPDEPTMSIAMSTPVVAVNGSAVTVSASLTTTGGPQTFAYIQIAVRGPSGQNNDVGFKLGATVDGKVDLTGGFTAPVGGTWTAYATYNKTGGSAQSDWIDGPKKTFTVTLATTDPGTGTGGGTTTPPISSAGVPKVGRSGMPWNSGCARWDSGTPTNSPGLADAFGTWRNRPVDGFLHFPPRGDWTSMFNIPASFSTWPGYIVWSIPPQPEGSNNSPTASGSNNARWEDFGKKLAASGLNKSTVIIRIWEVNGYWYNWAWGNEHGTKSAPNTPESFVAAVKNVSVSLKKYAPNVKISINMTRGQGRGGTTWQSVYNQLLGSHQYGRIFDIIGYDTYDWYPATNPGNWDGTLRESPGFNDIASYCRSNGLQIGVEEWALVGSSQGGGGDNPYFITQMYGVFNSIKDILAYEGYYEDKGAPDTLDHRMINGGNDYHNSVAAYRSSSRWGR